MMEDFKVITLREGDRIRLVRMPDDPNPIVPGSEGTVESVRWVHGGGAGQDFMQVSVSWDTGRRLMLSMPPDVVERFEPVSRRRQR